MLKRLGYWCIRNGYSVPKLNSLQRLADLYMLRQTLDRLRIDVVLDVGANKGDYAQQLREIGFEGVIISFEPIPEDYEITEGKAAKDSKWIVVNKAVGDKNEVRKFNVIRAGKNKTTALSSLLDAEAFTPAEVIDVEVIRLDQQQLSAFYEMGAANIFLKSDTQGYDIRVWDGASELHPNIKGLQIELSVLPIYETAPTFTEALKRLRDDGMHILSLSVVSRIGKNFVVEFDCLMSRRD